MGIASGIGPFLRAQLDNRAVIAGENLALYQEPGVLLRSAACPHLRRRDRTPSGLWGLA